MASGLNVGQNFQESLAKNLQDTEDDQYLGRLGAFLMDGASSSRSRPVVKRTHTRIQVPNFGALQMLLAATEGDQTKKKAT